MNKLLFVSALFTAGLVLTGCNQAQSSPNKASADDIAIPVEVAISRQGEISSSYRTTTTLAATEEADLISKASGVIEKILVEEGDAVEAGQLLAVLDNERQRLLLAKERAELSRLEGELQRMSEMHQRQLVSTEVYDKLRWQLDATKAAVDLAELALAETEIRAPFAGVISRRYARTGQLINQFTSKSLFHLISNQRLEAVVHLPEQQLAQARVGQGVLLQLAGHAPLRAELNRIAPVVDAQSGTVRATLLLDNQHGQLRPGLFAQVEVQFDVKTDALLIPKRALMSSDNQHSVYVLDSEGRVQRQTLVLGYQAEQAVEVVSGLESGQQVVIAGHAALKNDSLVQVVHTRDFH